MNVTALDTPARMVRTGSGKWVPASKPFGSSPIKERKFLICLQFYEGDREVAEDLASLICDLERTRNHQADILLVRRADAKEFGSTARAKLESKFDKVMTHTCRRTGARGYPYGPNELFYDLVTLLPQTPPYRDDYYAFINLEPDAVPTRPGWITELITEWKAASAEGFGAVGHIHDNPTRHLNGMAVYAIDIWRRVGSNILAGGSPQVCYDIRHARNLLPHAKHSPLIFFHYRHSTTTPDEVFSPRGDGSIEPAIFHGVKDCTARDAVRARHITMTEVRQVKRPNVYTYYHQIVGRLGDDAEVQAILDYWRQGWTSRGWNPIILSFKDAQKHPRFAEFEAAVAKFPNASSDKARTVHQFFRWLALDTAGGGLLTDYDVLPDTFTPANKDNPVPCVFQSDNSKVFAGEFPEGKSSWWVDEIIKYDPQPSDKLGETPHVTDHFIATHAALPFQMGMMAHFNADLIGTGRKSVAMERFLRGK